MYGFSALLQHKDSYHLLKKPYDAALLCGGKRSVSFRPKRKPSRVIKYIGRCLGRPAIAASRIDSYDGDLVTFHSFGYDPLKCPNCSTIMLFLERYFNHKAV